MGKQDKRRKDMEHEWKGGRVKIGWGSQRREHEWMGGRVKDRMGK